MTYLIRIHVCLTPNEKTGILLRYVENQKMLRLDVGKLMSQSTPIEVSVNVNAATGIERSLYNIVGRLEVTLKLIAQICGGRKNAVQKRRFNSRDIILFEWQFWRKY